MQACVCVCVCVYVQSLSVWLRCSPQRCQVWSSQQTSYVGSLGRHSRCVELCILCASLILCCGMAASCVGETQQVCAAVRAHALCALLNMHCTALRCVAACCTDCRALSQSQSCVAMVCCAGVGGHDEAVWQVAVFTLSHISVLRQVGSAYHTKQHTI